MTEYQIKILTLINKCKDPDKAGLLALDYLTNLSEEPLKRQDSVSAPQEKVS